jgi:hypothetical protein
MRRRFQEGGQVSDFGDVLPSGPIVPFGGEIDVTQSPTPPDIDWSKLGGEVSDALHSAAVATGAYRDPNRPWGQTLFEAANVAPLTMPVEGAPGAASRGVSAVNLRDLPLPEAIDAAKAEPHIQETPDGGFVGAPRNVQTRQDLQDMRDNFDKQVETGAPFADWYGRARRGNVEIAGPDPARQHLLAQEQALFSPQSTPETNLGFALQAHNAY